MSPQDILSTLKKWMPILYAILFAGGGFGGGAIYADSKPTRSEVKVMIAESVPLVELRKDVEHLTVKVRENHVATEKKLDKIIAAVER